MRAHTLFALVAASACTNPPVAELSPADKDAIVAWHDGVEALVQGPTPDWSGFVARHYTPDAVVLPPNEPRLTGHAAITSWFSAFPPASKWETKVETVVGSVSHAVLVGSYDIVMDPPGGEPMPDQGKFVEVLVRQGDGSWLVAYDTFNSDLPVAAPAPVAEAVPSAEAMPVEGAPVPVP